jgi:mxaJ protein
MCLRFPSVLTFALLVVAATVASAQTTRPGVLCVVAEPNNLPFSNDRREGFENKIAELVAREMNASLEYHWRAMRRGYWRETIKGGLADVVIGVPRDLDMALTTEPYYRSGYVFVTRDGSPTITSFDDPRLARLTIGIPLTGEDNPPPAIALGRRGLISNVRGYMVYGDYARPNPPARLIDAVANGEVDVAVAWGPLAGYFAQRRNAAGRGLLVTPVTPQAEEAGLTFAFDIAMGVAKKNTPLRDRLNEIIRAKRSEIDAILDAYAVPRVPAATPSQKPTPGLDHYDPQREEVPGCCE